VPEGNHNGIGTLETGGCSLAENLERLDDASRLPGSDFSERRMHEAADAADATPTQEGTALG
jgi:hypothetical protein